MLFYYFCSISASSLKSQLASAELEAVRSRLVRCIAAGNEAGAAEAAAPEPALKAKVHALRQRAATAKGKYQTLKAAAQGAVPPQATGPCTHDTMAASAAAARAPKPAPPAMVDSRIANREALEINPELRHLKSKVSCEVVSAIKDCCRFLLQPQMKERCECLLTNCCLARVYLCVHILR